MECIDGVLPEDTEEIHLSTLNKTSIQQYKLSLIRESNVASQALLDSAWQKHNDLFTAKQAASYITEAAEVLTQATGLDNISLWQSSLSSFDVEEMVTKSLSQCHDCSNPVPYHDLQYLQNNCQCEGIEKTSNLDSSKKLSHSYKNQDSKYEEQRGIFKPRFGRTKINTQIESPMDVEPVKSQEDEDKAHKSMVAKITFKTAREQFLASNPAAKRTLGTSRKAQGKFISPMIGAQEREEAPAPAEPDDRLRHLDPKMVELIESEIMEQSSPIEWDDIAGLQLCKSVLQEAVVWPLLRPDIFSGLRRPPRGILLFGPPGTGKTLIGKCVAAQCRATFFNISASSLTSKWIGDGEKMVRALFAVARARQPAVIFIDEIDSLLSARGEGEHEASRRIKTEFLVQFDGAATADEERLLVVGATNRPQELDDAARRRLVKRLYVPLPDQDARAQMIGNLLRSERHSLSAAEAARAAALAAGFSGADVRALCSEAAMGPVRALPLSQIASIDREQVRPVCMQDFVAALQRVRPSVSPDDLGQYEKWNATYGQGF